MADEIRMPALGQTSDELRIVRWLKEPGERVELGELLLEVETDKAVLEIESARAGTLLEIACPEGESAEAGAVIAYVGQAGAPVQRPAPAGPAPVAASPVAVPTHRPLPGKVLATPVARRLAREQGIELALVQGSGPGGLIETRDVRALLESLQAPETGEVRISPLAREMARQHGIELAGVQGSGPQGRIEKRDIEALIQPRPSPSLEGGEYPVPRHRQIIAQRLVQSATSIPQIRLSMTIAMEVAQSLLSAQRAGGLAGLTYTHLILRALSQALRLHPELNRVWVDEGPRYRPLARADVGLAIASEDNLLVATIPEPDQSSLAELVPVVSAAVERGRRGALSRQDIVPAAISLSNLGMYGIDDFQALVDPSQTAILAVGRVADQVAVIDKGIRVVPQMKVSLTVDHRVVDGAQAAMFLQTIREILEKGAG